MRVRGCGGRESAQWWGLAEAGNPHGQPAGFWAELAPQQEGAPSRERVFYSTTERPGTHPVSPSLDRLATRVNAAGNLTSQAGTNAWNPTLVEIAVLGCHQDAASPVPGPPDDAEALALAVHQLRQAPDYAAALSLPLPLHLASQAQAYVLPMLVEDSPSPDTEAVESHAGQDLDELDPDLAEAAGLAVAPDEGDEEADEVL
ncbi:MULTISPECIES: RNaseH domain-containing protein [Streptomyces]|uniref:RNaseH domain-containing protein n=1 Tax=Streptomyces TaxID=1883 RepID=UPI001F3DB28A|nr:MULTISPECIES: RNaseH domain-containing protein [Streptomyces]MDX2917984.1 RNaseH domain-containing protein [Streptomyces sp. NE06-03C]MDX3606077.1 RNaseH domain-containing protein [Streptomyces sp. FL06-04B]MDX3734007.1 RNaseH domain-containing protein [Streptomyces sp. ID01-15D]